MDDGQLRWTCLNVIILIDATGGTGGGLFRYMYGRFLSEAAELIGEEQIKSISARMGQIGYRW